MMAPLPSCPLSSLPQRWVAGPTGSPGRLALSPVPKGPGPVSEHVINLPPSVGATAQECHRSLRPVILSRSAPVSEDH